ncbi:MAG: prephenate dehydrogenase [Deltaproteobacteria bacterium]|nr:prephenate dehydrogenase [Deltaproteobacteria bacterium]
MTVRVAERLAILGLGLLGGSVALAARHRGLAAQIVGSGRSRESVATAGRSGAFDAVVPLEEAVRDADLVLLATPVSAMAGVLRRAAPALASGCVVTDVGSVKAALTETLPGLLPPGARFVGSHPMAGSHERGMQHARADLFEGAVCLVTPTASSDAGAVARVEALWRGLGGRVERCSPDAHDAAVGWVSHVPHALAFAFAAALRSAPPGATALAGPGFRDFTRIARSDAELWSEILTLNRKALAGPLQAFSQQLAALAHALDAGDADAVARLLSEARETLSQAAVGHESKARSGGEKPEIRD